MPAIDPEGTDCSELLQRFRYNEIEIAKRNGAVNFRRSFVTISERTKHPFYIATHDGGIDHVWASIMKYQYYYEEKLTDIIAEVFEEKKKLGKESIMLDVGANIGWFSLVAAAHGASRVYSFEPNTQNTLRFCESLALNGWRGDSIIPISKGVGKIEEQKELYAIEGQNPGSFSFNKGTSNPPPRVVGTMNITTLDSFAERHGWFESKPSIAFLKVDVEKFEREAIEGAEKLLKARLIENIAMELKPDHSEEAKSKIVRILFDAGYTIKMHGAYLGPDIPVTINYTDWKDLVKDLQEDKYKENVLFRRKE